MPVVGHRGLPAVVDDGGGAGLGDDRRAGDGVAGTQLLAAVQGYVAPGAARVEADGAPGRRSPVPSSARAERSGCSVRPVASTERASTTIGRSSVKRVRGAVTVLEGPDHGVGFGELDGEGGVGAVVAELGAAGDPDAVLGDVLGEEFGARRRLQVVGGPHGRRASHVRLPERELRRTARAWPWCRRGRCRARRAHRPSAARGRCGCRASRRPCTRAGRPRRRRW